MLAFSTNGFVFISAGKISPHKTIKKIWYLTERARKRLKKWWNDAKLRGEKSLLTKSAYVWFSPRQVSCVHRRRSVNFFRQMAG